MALQGDNLRPIQRAQTGMGRGGAVTPSADFGGYTTKDLINLREKRRAEDRRYKEAADARKEGYLAQITPAGEMHPTFGRKWDEDSKSLITNAADMSNQDILAAMADLDRTRIMGEAIATDRNKKLAQAAAGTHFLTQDFDENYFTDSGEDLSDVNFNELAFGISSGMNRDFGVRTDKLALAENINKNLKSLIDNSSEAVSEEIENGIIQLTETGEIDSENVKELLRTLYNSDGNIVKEFETISRENPELGKSGYDLFLENIKPLIDTKNVKRTFRVKPQPRTYPPTKGDKTLDAIQSLEYQKQSKESPEHKFTKTELNLPKEAQFFSEIDLGGNIGVTEGKIKKIELTPDGLMATVRYKKKSPKDSPAATIYGDEVVPYETVTNVLRNNLGEDAFNTLQSKVSGMSEASTELDIRGLEKAISDSSGFLGDELSAELVSFLDKYGIEYTDLEDTSGFKDIKIGDKEYDVSEDNDRKAIFEIIKNKASGSGAGESGVNWN